MPSASVNSVIVSDGAGEPIRVEQLSDGFRSVLSMTFELLRGMVAAYGEQAFFESLSPEHCTVNLPGVVAIDEVDAHLHPAWQARIGNWLVERFPLVQFIVTTHSPIICRSAERGSIWRLPTPGKEEAARQIVGTDRDRLINGSILDAMDTEYFGEDITRSGKSHDMMLELARLNQRQLNSPLSKEERRRRHELRTVLPSDSALSIHPDS